MKILLVEDDETSIAVLTRGLTAQHYVVDVVRDGEAGWTYGSTFEYDVLVLDIMLPKLDGIRLCQRFRTEGVTTPILLLTAQDASTMKVQGLDAGADDYVVKPFDLSELIARIRALLRRGSANPFPLLNWENLWLNPSTCEVTYDDKPLTLTTKEYELLELLLRDSQYLFSAEEILDRLWSSEEFPSEATVRSHIRRLRQKLSAAGAPPDFITTVHGRGYYLKSLTPRSPSLASAVEEPPSRDRAAQQQAEYLAFLNETWANTQPKNLDQLTILRQLVNDLKAGCLNSQYQTYAHQIAHKLAGTLGIFGLMEATQVARQLEHLLDGSSPLRSQDTALIESLVVMLCQLIEQTVTIQSPDSQLSTSPLVWIIDAEPTFAQSLATIAANQGIRTAIAPHLKTAKTWLSSLPTHLVQPAPDAILLKFSAQSPRPQKGSTTRTVTPITPSLDLLQALAHRYPHAPILVLGNSDQFTDRLEVTRRGGKFLSDNSISPQQTLEILMQLLDNVHPGAKVMVVDDDQTWLQTLPAMLKPWGFKVTTLADPQQFWTVLQTLSPDLLVLDVSMPQINGLELCQVLRSHPHWQRIPVVFLSALTDSKTQNHAFTVGADDYLCKPVLAMDLAYRIRHRLRRMHA